jgi:hypothetical protein
LNSLPENLTFRSKSIFDKFLISKLCSEQMSRFILIFAQRKLMYGLLFARTFVLHGVLDCGVYLLIGTVYLKTKHHRAAVETTIIIQFRNQSMKVDLLFVQLTVLVKLSRG